MLNEALKQRIYANLGRGNLLPLDFVILTENDTNTKSKDSFFRINYVHEARYSFRARIPGSKTSAPTKYDADRLDFHFPVDVSPGEAGTDERIDVIGIESLLQQVGAWAGRVDEELKASWAGRQLEQQRAQIEELVARLDGSGAEVLTQADADKFQQNLSALEEKLAAAISEAENDKAKRDAQLAKLHQDIEYLRDQVGSLNKASTWRIILSRVFWFIAKNPKVQELALKAAEHEIDKLLPPPT